jgi:isoleucyl-tRNA synthetase
MATDYKNTLNLPRTDFPMKADLVAREPERLKKWETAGLYAKIQAAHATAEKFVLHDGPPFANGDVHIGTALNKILKDIIIKYKTLRGLAPRLCRAGIATACPSNSRFPRRCASVAATPRRRM